jgi:hypothetical protein
MCHHLLNRVSRNGTFKNQNLSWLKRCRASLLCQDPPLCNRLALSRRANRQPEPEANSDFVRQAVADSQKIIDAQVNRKVDEVKASFDTYLKGEDVRLSGAMRTSQIEHPNTSPEQVGWLLQQGQENLITDWQFRKQLKDIGSKLFTDSVINEENALVAKRQEQWDQIRSNAANPGDPNMESKQAILFQIITGSYTDGQEFGRMNGNRPEPLKTNVRQMKLEGAEALVKANATKGIDHDLTTRETIELLRGKQRKDGSYFMIAPEDVRIKLLDAMIPMSKDDNNRFLGKHPKDVVLATLVTALDRSHLSNAREESFQLAAMQKVMELDDVRAIGIIQKLSVESSINKVRDAAIIHLSKLKEKAKGIN